MKRIAIVGSGITATALAYHIVKAGHAVDMFEAGAETPYPHTPQFEREKLYANAFSPPSPPIPPEPPEGVQGLSQSGDYGEDFNRERFICVGGQGTRWFGITPRFVPQTFKPKSLNGYADDWPITYDDIEPYYCRAEAYLGISGDAGDNPFAPWRSQGFPLPPFELTANDQIIAARLREKGLYVHTTPQARVRHFYDGRPGCQNYAACETCPIGARYSPNHHLEIALKTGLLTLHTRAPVRRIVMQGNRARALVYNPDYGTKEVEHPADLIIVAAGGIESARLLLLSADTGAYRNGLGNASGQVGRNFTIHHVFWGRLLFNEKWMPGRAGPPTALSHQFAHPEGQRNYGGITVELFDSLIDAVLRTVAEKQWQSGADMVEAMRPSLTQRNMNFNVETIPSPEKFVDLSGPKDRFGDPFAHVTYKFDAFDHETYGVAKDLSKRFGEALGAEDIKLTRMKDFWSAHHHLGTCRMGHSVHDSVVDSFGQVHDTEGLYVCGGSTFVTATSLQPTLTMTTLAIRTADKIISELA